MWYFYVVVAVLSVEMLAVKVAVAALAAGVTGQWQ